MHPFVLCRFISSSACFILVRSLIIVSISSFDISFRSSFSSWWEISASNLASVFFCLAFLMLACLREHSLILSLIIFHSKESSTALPPTSLLSYSCDTSVILSLIWFTYSLSFNKDVFGFQKPRPLGFVFMYYSFDYHSFRWCNFAWIFLFMIRFPNDEKKKHEKSLPMTVYTSPCVPNG